MQHINMADATGHRAEQAASENSLCGAGATEGSWEQATVEPSMCSMSENARVKQAWGILNV